MVSKSSATGLVLVWSYETPTGAPDSWPLAFDGVADGTSNVRPSANEACDRQRADKARKDMLDFTLSK